MAEQDRWGDRDRAWREDRSWNERDRERGRSQPRGYYGGGGDDDRYTARDAGGADRWRQMHRDRRHEGPAGYNDSGPAQGGWEFGDEEQGGVRGQGYERYGYGRDDDNRRPSQSSYYGQQGRDPGVGSAYGESWGANREYGRGGGYGSQSTQSSQGYGSQGYGSQTGYAGQGGYGLSAQGSDYGGYSTGQSGQSRYAYGAHTPYGYRGRNEYDDRGRGGEYADAGHREQEGRSWLERAGERVSAFFGADDQGQHRGRGPKGYRRSDDRIREDVSDRLTDDAWLDASNIEVEVKDCEVVLKGSVNSREDKRRAENLAEAISGVNNVQNHLRVSGRESDYEGFGSSKMTGETSTGTATSEAQNRTAATNKTGGSTRLQAPDSAPGLNT